MIYVTHCWYAFSSWNRLLVGYKNSENISTIEGIPQLKILDRTVMYK